MVAGRNRVQATLVEGERSHHCATPAPQRGETSQDDSELDLVIE